MKIGKRTRLNSGAQRDLLWVLVLVVLSTALAIGLDLFELIHRATRTVVYSELDEIVVGLGALSVGLGWFAWRRWQEARTESEQRERAADEVRRRAENLSFLISVAPGIFYTRKPRSDWVLEYVSPNVEALLGYDADEFIQAFTPSASPVHPEDRRRVVENWVSTTDHDYDIQEYRIRHKNGAYRLFCDIAQLFRDSTGRPLRVTGYLQDITENKRAEDALRAAKEEAERANAGKSRFLAAASHDLRQPLQVIRLLHSLLSKELVEEKQAELSQDMSRAIGVMDDLLDGVLDISKLEAGIVTPELENFHIDGLISGIYCTFRSQARERRLELRIVPSSAVIQSDPVLLERIIRNLISNAIHRSQASKVLLGVRRLRNMVRIEVADNGTGIPDDQIEAIFEEYYQIDNPARQRDRGLGLGLSIVKRLGQLLGHSVGVRSAPNKGSTFWIEIPLARTQGDTAIAPPAKQWPAPDLGGHTVLLVEDDALVLAATRRLLKTWGAEVETAVDAEAAFSTATREPEPPDVIIADYSLGAGANGRQLIERLRGHFGLRIPAVHVTGDTSPATIREMSVLADTAIAHKPVDPAELGGLIQDVLQPEFETMER